MSFGGHVAAMVASIKNNNILRGKRKSYFDNKIALQDVSDKMKIPLKKATPEQLRLIRAKLKKQRFYTRIRVFFVLLILSPLIWMVLTNMWGVVKEEIPKSEKEIFEEYYGFINKGDSLFISGRYESATNYYSAASELKPYRASTENRQVLAYIFICLNKNEECGAADWHLTRFVKYCNGNKEQADKLHQLLLKAYCFNNPEEKEKTAN